MLDKVNKLETYAFKFKSSWHREQRYKWLVSRNCNTYLKMDQIGNYHQGKENQEIIIFNLSWFDLINFVLWKDEIIEVSIYSSETDEYYPIEKSLYQIVL